jgi:outer membrane immunogenic protein
VLGVEGSGSWADSSGDSDDLLGLGLTAHSRIDFLGTFTGRIGWAWDRTCLTLRAAVRVPTKDTVRRARRCSAPI